uniref:Uncharacterized protein n=1 Tax=Desertifilum tharense IPPAS B-1220 TaxID=1781255 RepID=A0ACD5GYS3_9CYAN
MLLGRAIALSIEIVQFNLLGGVGSHSRLTQPTHFPMYRVAIALSIEIVQFNLLGGVGSR